MSPRGCYGEELSIEKLKTELWKQKQLTEVLRHEVGQQESEKRKVTRLVGQGKGGSGPIVSRSSPVVSRTIASYIRIHVGKKSSRWR